MVLLEKKLKFGSGIERAKRRTKCSGFPDYEFKV